MRLRVSAIFSRTCVGKRSSGRQNVHDRHFSGGIRIDSDEKPIAD